MRIASSTTPTTERRGARFELLGGRQRAHRGRRRHGKSVKSVVEKNHQKNQMKPEKSV
nr:MAG TPA: hypothetical protein [Bacteriophage sp.]